jgi:hypothetical protein
MPETKIMKCLAPEDFNEVNNLLSSGFELNKAVKGTGIISTENAVVYHLIYYSQEEKRTLASGAIETKISSVKSVPLEDVDKLLEQDYEVHELYAKTATMVKRTSTPKAEQNLAESNAELDKNSAQLRTELKQFTES